MKKFILICAITLLKGFCQAQVTTVTLQTIADAAIGYDDGTGATSNFGNASQNAGYWIPGYPSGINANRALIDFNLSSLPANATIISASMNLYAYGQIGSYSGHMGQSNSCYLERITQSWLESVVTWSNQPTTTTVNSVLLNQSTSPTQDYLNINVLTLVQDMMNNPSTSFGFLLKLVSENATNGLVFWSKDQSNPNVVPNLVISYSVCTNVTPSISATQGICSGSPATMTVSNAGSNPVSWYSTSSSTLALGTGSVLTSPNLTVAATPAYYIYYAEAGNCSSNPRSGISVLVNPVPVVTVVSTPSLMCVRQTGTLIASGALSYVWAQNSTSLSTNSSLVVTLNTSTTYVVTGTNSYGCSQSSSYTQLVTECLGIEQQDETENLFSIFPNPSSGTAAITCNLNQSYTLFIRSAAGVLLDTYEVKAGNFEIAGQKYATGIYLVQLLTNGKYATQRWVISK